MPSTHIRSLERLCIPATLARRRWRWEDPCSWSSPCGELQVQKGSASKSQGRDSVGRHPTLTSPLHERVYTLLHKHVHTHDHGHTYLKYTHMGHCVLGTPVGFGTHVSGLLGEERWVLLKEWRFPFRSLISDFSYLWELIFEGGRINFGSRFGATESTVARVALLCGSKDRCSDCS